ncbi:prolipoprotein diacylglyceryl transferase [Blastococcus mobilis]|uniref:Phosphatidylglycerol--prolipoprotein diacylglyceryl transferase n=1 Tax=Blastococcus mobilis TaxID=1938746 RepID=A0A238VG61_9ACTN|nr:prolipoprotein diacylglyceryl transferase [Blastococcus mobilis]SNR33385.1 Prolipoprotein diacylglyceryl transferase [Blastococcus mobilis]
MNVLASIPSPSESVWELGPFPLRAYALCIIAGIVAAVLMTEKRWVARGGAPGDVLDIAVWAVPFGIIGGRIYHVISSPRAYFGEGGDPMRAFAIWEGGLGIWGAITLGGVGAWIACRQRGIPLPAFADALAPGLLVAQAIGRLGNWFNQELFGGPTTLPWGLEIAPEHRPAEYLDVATFHPTFLYEMLWNLAAAAFVIWADRRFRLGHGRAFALYVVSYCAGRLWIELLRTDPAETFFGIRLNVFTSVVVGLLAVAYFVWQRGKPREVIHRQNQDDALPADAGPAGSTRATPAGDDEHRPAEPG